jgi:Fungal specific transcription factor domain
VSVKSLFMQFDLFITRLAMAIGLHLEPQVSSSTHPEELLDALWNNELRKRTWLNLFVWDKYCSQIIISSNISNNILAPWHYLLDDQCSSTSKIAPSLLR